MKNSLLYIAFAALITIAISSDRKSRPNNDGIKKDDNDSNTFQYRGNGFYIPAPAVIM